jgi:hypothetical protein
LLALLLCRQLLRRQRNALQPLHRRPLRCCHSSVSASCLHPLLLLLLLL